MIGYKRNRHTHVTVNSHVITPTSLDHDQALIHHYSQARIFDARLASSMQYIVVIKRLSTTAHTLPLETYFDCGQLQSCHTCSGYKQRTLDCAFFDEIQADSS